MRRLTEHFFLEELTHSDLAVRMGIDNTAPQELIPHLTAAAWGMESIRKALQRPITISSGYRCEELEKVLCKRDFDAWCFLHKKNVGTLAGLAEAWAEYFKRKAHPQGYAIDWTCPAFGPPSHCVSVVRNARIPFDQLIEEGTWVHTSFDPRLRGEVLTARFDAKGVPVYEHA